MICIWPASSSLLSLPWSFHASCHCTHHKLLKRRKILFPRWATGWLTHMHQSNHCTHQQVLKDLTLVKELITKTDHVIYPTEYFLQINKKKLNKISIQSALSLEWIIDQNTIFAYSRFLFLVYFNCNRSETFITFLTLPLKNNTTQYYFLLSLSAPVLNTHMPISQYAK